MSFNRRGFFNRLPFNRTLGGGIIHYPDKIYGTSPFGSGISGHSPFGTLTKASSAIKLAVTGISPSNVEVGGNSAVSLTIRDTSRTS